MDFAAPAAENGGVGRRPSTEAGGFPEPVFSEQLPDFDVVSVSREDEVIVALRGEIDLATAPLLERELELGPVRAARAVLVDLERVAFMDLTGLRPLVSLAIRSRPGQRIAITAGPPPVQRLLELSGLRRHFTVVAPHWP
jgi:anti-sigma B factor antagonist